MQEVVTLGNVPLFLGEDAKFGTEERRGGAQEGSVSGAQKRRRSVRVSGVVVAG